LQHFSFVVVNFDVIQGPTGAKGDPGDKVNYLASAVDKLISYICCFCYSCSVFAIYRACFCIFEVSSHSVRL